MSRDPTRSTASDPQIPSVGQEREISLVDNALTEPATGDDRRLQEKPEILEEFMIQELLIDAICGVY